MTIINRSLLQLIGKNYLKSIKNMIFYLDGRGIQPRPDAHNSAQTDLA